MRAICIHELREFISVDLREKFMRWFIAVNLFSTFLLGATDDIEYCALRYGLRFAQYGISDGVILNPFYDNYFHIYLRRNNEVLSFEPSRKQRIHDENAALGSYNFSGASCEVLNSTNSDLIWQNLKSYFERQEKLFEYDVLPSTKGRNGHIVTREALKSVGITPPATDGIVNPVYNNRL